MAIVFVLAPLCSKPCRTQDKAWQRQIWGTPASAADVLSLPSLGLKSPLFVFPVVTSLFLRCLDYLLTPHRKRNSNCLPSQLAALPWMAFCLKVHSQVLLVLGKEFL